MEKPSDPSSYIYQGCWINWGKGRILGPTLTLSNTNATLLTNILALFVTMAGGQFWTIVRFILHQLRASFPDNETNFLHNKEQVVLRNSTSAFTTAQLLLTLRWAARKTGVDSPTHSIPVVFIAVLSAAFFLVAGAFSNTVANAGSEVIFRSPFCGFWNETYVSLTDNGLDGAMASPEILAMFQENVAHQEHDLELSLQYALNCYLGQSTGSSSCDTFPISTLPLSTTTSEECPFQKEICRPDVETIVFDTGALDTHTDFGINAPKSERFSYRRVTNCTVLDDAAQTTGWVNQSTSVQNSSQPVWKIATANFGDSVTWAKNDTYTYSNFADFYTGFAGEWSMSYQLGNDFACAKGSDMSGFCWSSFAPIPELEQPYADINLLYLGFTGTYMEPIDDPWFSAHQPFHLKTKIPFLQTTYARDAPISTMGCTEQHQFCTADECSPLLGFGQVQLYIQRHMNFTPKQNITLDRVLNAAADSLIVDVVGTLAYISSPFLALDKRMSESHTISLPLPKDQWKQEAGYWQAISLAQLQRMMIEYGTGQIAAQPKYLLPPSTPAQKWICNNFMIRSTVYESFSILALTLIVLVGLAVIFLSLTIEEVAACLWRWLGKGDAAGEVWRDHDMLGEQVWRARIKQSAAFSKEESLVCPKTDPLPSYLQDETQKYLSDKIRKLDRAESQALSEEDCERLLGIARAYEGRM